MDLSIIILNYNTKDQLRDCLKSIIWLYREPEIVEETEGPKKLEAEIIVVDNNSTDGSVEMIEKEFPQIKLIKNQQNLGFAAGNNIGIKQAHGEYILLLNPDTIVPHNTLADMIEFMEKNPRFAASTCLVELNNGEIDWASHRGFPTPWASLTYFLGLEKLDILPKIFGQYHQTWQDLSQPHEIDACSGCFMLVRREAINEVGLLNEDYFIYAEDIDWCYRFKEAKWHVAFNPVVKITHLKGVASGLKPETQEITTADLATKIKMTEYFFDTMKIFYQKHYESKYPGIVTSLVYLLVNLMKKYKIWKLKRNQTNKTSSATENT